MITNKNNHFLYRYTNKLVPSLINQLQERRQTQELKSLSKVKQQRTMNHSMSMSEQRKKQIEQRSLFNNKTKEGQFIDNQTKLIPYRFVPKYKNETFIMPNRVFQKGKAGKRFHIKMQDTSIYSFRDKEANIVQSVLKKPEKQQTIISRRLQQFNRIIDEDDGNKNAGHYTWCIKNRKIFNYTNSSSELFSQCPRINEVKDQQSLTVRKTTLAKTFDFSNRWKQNSSSSDLFHKTQSKVMCKNRSQLSQNL